MSVNSSDSRDHGVSNSIGDVLDGHHSRTNGGSRMDDDINKARLVSQCDVGIAVRPSHQEDVMYNGYSTDDVASGDEFSDKSGQSAPGRSNLELGLSDYPISQHSIRNAERSISAGAGSRAMENFNHRLCASGDHAQGNSEEVGPNRSEENTSE